MTKQLLSCVFLLLFVAVSGCSTTGNGIRFSGDFESGNLPDAKQLDFRGHAWELALRDDNDDANLPNAFCTWWYLRADNVPVGQKVRLEFSRLGFPYYFVPLYSYDQKNWQHFDERDVTLEPGCDVTKPQTCRLIVNTSFTKPIVWIARTFPYTTEDLANYLTSISSNPYVTIDTLGHSPFYQIPLQLVTISDGSVTAPKKTIWINARTHAAEVGSSFLLEGLISAVLADDELGRSLRNQFIFKIVPMENADGVKMGNYRTNAASINLEKQWIFTSESNPYLVESAAVENRVVNQAMAASLKEENVVLALSLHSTNSAPDTAAFFYPHFGNSPDYSEQEQNLWNKQLAFIKSVTDYYDGRIEPVRKEGSARFLNGFGPGRWWWENKKDAVNSITLETTYSRAGFDRWVTPADWRNLGVAVAKAINDNHRD